MFENYVFSMSKSHPHKSRLESTHSASFCTKNHQNLFINKIVVKNTVFYLGIAYLIWAHTKNTARKPTI